MKKHKWLILIGLCVLAAYLYFKRKDKKEDKNTKTKTLIPTPDNKLKSSKKSVPKSSPIIPIKSLNLKTINSND